MLKASYCAADEHIINSYNDIFHISLGGQIIALGGQGFSLGNALIPRTSHS